LKKVLFEFQEILHWGSFLNLFDSSNMIAGFTKAKKINLRICVKIYLLEKGYFRKQ
jgi:hypothetical protein